MEEHSIGTFANRGQPIPVINIPGSDDGPPAPSPDEQHDRSYAHMKHDATETGIRDQDSPDEPSKPHKRSHSLQDRLFAKFVSCRHHEAQKLQAAKDSHDEMGN